MSQFVYGVFFIVHTHLVTILYYIRIEKYYIIRFYTSLITIKSIASNKIYKKNCQLVSEH